MIAIAGGSGPVHVLRLLPGEDVRTSLEGWARSAGIEGAGIVSAVGSLSVAHLRYAGRADGLVSSGDLEVCGLSGTISKHGLHLHLSIADRDGAMLGGHLLAGSVVRTTLEVVIQEIRDVRLLRTHDPKTSYDELDLRPLEN